MIISFLKKQFLPKEQKFFSSQKTNLSELKNRNFFLSDFNSEGRFFFGSGLYRIGNSAITVLEKLTNQKMPRILKVYGTTIFY